MIEDQKFNVVCVTKRNVPRKHAIFHLPITGEAVLKHVCFDERGSIRVYWPRVFFRGRDYEFSHIRKGLNGTALVVSVKVVEQNEDMYEFDQWDLYSDIPSGDFDLRGEPVTGEKIHGFAKWAIEHSDVHKYPWRYRQYCG